MFQFSPLGVAQISRVECLIEVIKQFHFRGLRDSHEPREVSMLETSESFRDISCRRSCCFSDLVLQLEVLFLLYAITERPNRTAKRVRQLPRCEILERSESGHEVSGCKQCASSTRRCPRVPKVPRVLEVPTPKVLGVPSGDGRNCSVKSSESTQELPSQCRCALLFSEALHAL